MKDKDIWTVEFRTVNRDPGDMHLGMRGTLKLYAKDVFEALHEATKQLKTFGYETEIIYGAKKMENEGEDETE